MHEWRDYLERVRTGAAACKHSTQSESIVGTTSNICGQARRDAFEIRRACHDRNHYLLLSVRVECTRSRVRFSRAICAPQATRISLVNA